MAKASALVLTCPSTITPTVADWPGNHGDPSGCCPGRVKTICVSCQVFAVIPPGWPLIVMTFPTCSPEKPDPVIVKSAGAAPLSGVMLAILGIAMEKGSVLA